jgi:hypothetical protein
VYLKKNNCSICNSEFELKSKKHPHQQYCSNKCIKTAYRQRHPLKDKLAKQRWVLENPEKRAQSSSKYQKQIEPIIRNMLLYELEKCK